MRRIVFLVKNGIGFGHIRRCMLVAKEIRALDPGIDIIFISQAGSLLLLQGSPFRVINFPFLHRLPNNQSEHAYKILLSEIVAGLEPTLVVEDTYPDDWYLSIPALQNVPKVLLLRRVTPFAFDDFRRKGYFSVYDRILIVQEKREFFAERQVCQSELLVRLTDKFRFIGPIFHLPTNFELDQARARYLVDDVPLVVVSAGAGGAYLNDSYCEHLFSSMSNVALRFLNAGIPARFIFILGPYYRGLQPEGHPNTVIVDFEPNLAALLHIASIAVIKPGFNTTYEALSGPADVILVPGISYMEDQHRWSEWLKESYNVSICRYNDVDHLFSEIRNLLQTSTRDRRRDQIAPGQAEAAKAIIKEMNRLQDAGSLDERFTGLPLFLLIGQISPAYSTMAQRLFRNGCPRIASVVESQMTNNPGDIPNLDCLREQRDHPLEMQQDSLSFIFLQASKPMDLTPEMLVKHGVKVVFYTNKATFGVNAKQWCKHYLLKARGILEKELYHFEVASGWERKLSYRISKMLSRRSPVAIYLDLSRLTQWEELISFAESLRKWLTSTRCRVLSVNEVINELAMEQLSPLVEVVNELEIEKLA